MCARDVLAGLPCSDIVEESIKLDGLSTRGMRLGLPVACCNLLLIAVQRF